MKRVLIFALLLAWCGTLLALRGWRAQNTTYFFLAWNLFLAALPFAAALLFERTRAFVVQAIAPSEVEGPR